MLRWPRRILTSASLLLLFVVLAAWVDNAILDRTGWVKSGRVVVTYTAGSVFLYEVSTPAVYGRMLDAGRFPSAWPGAGYRPALSERLLGDWWLMSMPQLSARIPLWFVALVFAVLPTSEFIVRWRRRCREAVGRCACGYDLRGSVGPCPECGKP